MKRSDLPVPTAGIVATHFVVAADVEAIAAFYSEVLGWQVVWRGIHPGAPTYVKFANIWIGINKGGGPTPDKPEIHLDGHADADRFDTFPGSPPTSRASIRRRSRSSPRERSVGAGRRVGRLLSASGPASVRSSDGDDHHETERKRWKSR